MINEYEFELVMKVLIFMLGIICGVVMGYASVRKNEKESLRLLDIEKGLGQSCEGKKE